MSMTLEMDGGGDGWRRVWSNGQTFFLCLRFPPTKTSTTRNSRIEMVEDSS